MLVLKLLLVLVLVIVPVLVLVLGSALNVCLNYSVSTGDYPWANFDDVHGLVRLE